VSERIVTSIDDAGSHTRSAGTAVPFAGLSSSLWARVEDAATRCRFRPKQVLFRSGTPADALYFVLSGRVRVSRETPDHVELLHHEGPGGVLAEIPVFGGGDFPATAIATEQTHCLKLPVALVRRLLRDEPAFVEYALARLAKRAQTLLQRIDELTATTVSVRIAGYIASHAGAGPFSLGMSQAALAEEIGTAREVVVRAIGSLVRAGALERVGRSKFVVANWSILRTIAGSGGSY